MEVGVKEEIRGGNKNYNERGRTNIQKLYVMSSHSPLFTN
jgi:hypothetical protein